MFNGYELFRYNPNKYKPGASYAIGLFKQPEDYLYAANLFAEVTDLSALSAELTPL